MLLRTSTSSGSQRRALRPIWIVIPVSVLALALGAPRLWGASEDACTIVALFFSTSLAFGAFIDAEVLYSLFFRVAKSGRGLGLTAPTRAVNWLVGQLILIMLLRVCDPRSGEKSANEITAVFICLSYMDFVFGMACAAHRRALGLEPDLGLYTIAAGPAVVYTIFLAYVTIRLNVSFLQLIVSTDSLVVFMLPLIHAMVLSPQLLAFVPNLMEPVGAAAPGADSPFDDTPSPAGEPAAAEAGRPRHVATFAADLLVSPSAPRVVYVALSVALWWHTPPLKVAMLLGQTPPAMLTEFRFWTAPAAPLTFKVLLAILLLSGTVLLALVLYWMCRTLCQGIGRVHSFLRQVRQRHGAARGRFAGGDVEASGITFVGLFDEHDVAMKICECGWGTSFHFADRLKGETTQQSMLRHEYFLAGRLGVKQNACLLDCGCGVGGPARNIARFTGASRVTAVTLSRCQVERGNDLCRREGAGNVELVQGNFSKLAFPDASFDAVYAIESIAHAPERREVYAEIFRVLKPGGRFAAYEWCLTDRYDPARPQHRGIIEEIEAGDGFTGVAPPQVLEHSLEKVGFQLLESRDCALNGTEGSDPWYLPLTPSWNPLSWPRFQFNPLMLTLMPKILHLGELLGLLPEGTVRVEAKLQTGGRNLARGGALGIFTPMWLLVARKPGR